MTKWNMQKWIKCNGEYSSFSQTLWIPTWEPLDPLFWEIKVEVLCYAPFIIFLRSSMELDLPWISLELIWRRIAIIEELWCRCLKSILLVLECSPSTYTICVCGCFKLRSMRMKWLYQHIHWHSNFLSTADIMTGIKAALSLLFKYLSSWKFYLLG